MIGVLAYGSLITNPGPELAAVIVARKADVLTPFNVEYARCSRGRGGAPTLVPTEDCGSPVRAVILALSVGAEAASDLVYRREAGKIGSAMRYREPPDSSTNAVRIDRFEDFEGFSVVLSTRIGANINPLNADRLATLAISSVGAADKGQDGITYLIEAKRSGIITPLTAPYERSIVAKTGTTSLEEALASLKS